MYTKLANSILTSTVWMESNETRIVWLTMLAMSDKHGEIQASIPGLAHIARVTVEQVETALGIFLAPDPYSRTKTDDGRRIEEIDGGWLLLNHHKYRDLGSDNDTKRHSADRQRRYRERAKRDANDVTRDVTRVTRNASDVTRVTRNVTRVTRNAASRPISHTDTDTNKRERESIASNSSAQADARAHLVFSNSPRRAYDSSEFENAWDLFADSVYARRGQHLTEFEVDGKLRQLADMRSESRAIAALAYSASEGSRGSIFEPRGSPTQRAGKQYATTIVDSGGL